MDEAVGNPRGVTRNSKMKRAEKPTRCAAFTRAESEPNISPALSPVRSTLTPAPPINLLEDLDTYFLFVVCLCYSARSFQRPDRSLKADWLDERSTSNGVRERVEPARLGGRWCLAPTNRPALHHPRPGIYNAVLRSDRFGTGHRLGRYPNARPGN